MNDIHATDQERVNLMAQALRLASAYLLKGKQWDYYSTLWDIAIVASLSPNLFGPHDHERCPWHVNACWQKMATAVLITLVHDLLQPAKKVKKPWTPLLVPYKPDGSLYLTGLRIVAPDSNGLKIEFLPAHVRSLLPQLSLN